MGLVDDDGKPAPALLVTDLIEDERKLLHGRDNDLLAVLDEPPQVAGSLRMPDGRAHLGVLLDRVADLLVQDAAVGDDDDGVERDGSLMLQADQLMGQPGDRVALAAARGMLDEVTLPGAVLRHIGKQAPNHIKLMVAGPDLGLLLAPGLVVFRLDHLGVVLQDVRQALAREYPAPQVVGLDPVRIGRIAGAVIPSAVERQEPRCLAFQVGAETDLIVVHGEMRHTAAELKQLLPRVAVPLVLLDGIIGGLLRQAVLQFEGEHGQAVDEQYDIQSPLGFVAAVAQLPGDRKAVLTEPLLGLLVAGGRGAVEEVQVERTVLDAMAEDFNGPSPADLTL